MILFNKIGLTGSGLRGDILVSIPLLTRQFNIASCFNKTLLLLLCLDSSVQTISNVYSSKNIVLAEKIRSYKI